MKKSSVIDTQRFKTLAEDLRRRINPAYATQLGTESYERRECADAIEALLAAIKQPPTGAKK